MKESAFGVMRCIRIGCAGMLGASGQEVTRLVCQQCGQNYQVRVLLEPIPPKEPDRLLPQGV